MVKWKRVNIIPNGKNKTLFSGIIKKRKKTREFPYDYQKFHGGWRALTANIPINKAFDFMTDEEREWLKNDQ